MSPVWPTHAGQALPDSQQHGIPLIELLPKLLLKAGKTLTILTSCIFELQDTGVVLRDGTRCLMCRARALKLQRNQAGPTARQITKSLSQVVLQISEPLLPGIRLDFLRREVLLQFAAFFLGGGHLPVANLDLVAILFLSEKRNLILARLNLNSESLDFGVGLVQALLQRFHLFIALLELLLYSLVALQIILCILFYVQLFLGFRSQFLESGVPFLSYLHCLVAFPLKSLYIFLSLLYVS
ncbi:hypothetical protein BDW60DRAFT_220540 [Aspergillus nidulans var. acristatus]